MKIPVIATITVLMMAIFTSAASAQSLYGTNDSQRFFDRGNRLIEKEIRTLQEPPAKPELQLGEQPKDTPKPSSSQNQQPTTAPTTPTEKPKQ